MTQHTLKIPKTRKEVKLWVHPEGLVIGSLFVREQSESRSGNEAPHEVMNQASPFVVLYLNQPSELRFYNRNSIIRVEYEDEDENTDSPARDIISCRLTLMDGSLIDGEIRESLPPDYSRLFDYLNQDSERFLRLYIENNQICLVNKSYINYVTTEHINNN